MTHYQAIKKQIHFTSIRQLDLGADLGAFSYLNVTATYSARLYLFL